MNDSQKADTDIIGPVENCVLGPDVVKLRVELTDLFALFLVVNILFESGFDEERPRGEEEVVERNIIIVKNGLTTETILKGKHKMRDCQDKILVKEVQNLFRIP